MCHEFHRDRNFLPAIADQGIVRRVVAREAVEILYRSSDIALTSLRAPELTSFWQVPKVIYGDPFRVGFCPAEVLREITLNVDVERCYSHEKGRLRAKSPFINHDQIIRQLTPLLNIKKKKGFKLRINLIQRYIRLNVLQEFINECPHTIQSCF